MGSTPEFLSSTIILTKIRERVVYNKWVFKIIIKGVLAEKSEKWFIICHP